MQMNVWMFPCLTVWVYECLSVCLSTLEYKFNVNAAVSLDKNKLLTWATTIATVATINIYTHKYTHFTHSYTHTLHNLTHTSHVSKLVVAFGCSHITTITNVERYIFVTNNLTTLCQKGAFISFHFPLFPLTLTVEFSTYSSYMEIYACCFSFSPVVEVFSSACRCLTYNLWHAISVCVCVWVLCVCSVLCVLCVCGCVTLHCHL